jgi:hypothetical protein
MGVAMIADGTTKMYFLSRLIDYIYEPTHKHRLIELEKIIKENCELMGYQHPSFAYNGNFYTLTTAGPRIRQKLHNSLINRLEDMNTEFKDVIVIERSLVQSYISTILSRSMDIGVWLAYLPSGLHGVILNDNKMVYIQITATKIPQEKIDELNTKHKAGYEALCNRLVLNLIL